MCIRDSPTGFRLLDIVLTGLGRGDLIILATRPGMGKTSFALNIATRVAMQQKVPVAIFSLEMTKMCIRDSHRLCRGRAAHLQDLRCAGSYRRAP